MNRHSQHINPNPTREDNKTTYQLELFFYEKQMSPPFRNQNNHKIAFSYVTRGII